MEQVVLQAGPLSSPSALLVAVALLALVVLTTLWVLGILGFEFGVFGLSSPA